MIAYIVALIVFIVMGAGGLYWLGYNMVANREFRKEAFVTIGAISAILIFILSFGLVIAHHVPPKPMQPCICVGATDAGTAVEALIR